MARSSEGGGLRAESLKAFDGSGDRASGSSIGTIVVRVVRVVWVVRVVCVVWVVCVDSSTIVVRHSMVVVVGVPRTGTNCQEGKDGSLSELHFE